MLRWCRHSVSLAWLAWLVKNSTLNIIERLWETLKMGQKQTIDRSKVKHILLITVTTTTTTTKTIPTTLFDFLQDSFVSPSRGNNDHSTTDNSAGQSDNVSPLTEAARNFFRELQRSFVYSDDVTPQPQPSAPPPPNGRFSDWFFKIFIFRNLISEELFTPKLHVCYEEQGYL